MTTETPDTEVAQAANPTVEQMIDKLAMYHGPVTIEGMGEYWRVRVGEGKPYGTFIDGDHPHDWRAALTAAYQQATGEEAGW